MQCLADGVNNMKRKKSTISAIILAKNEQARIEECIRSIQWVDEIIVINNSSVDDTSVLAKKHNAIVYDTTLTDFSKLRDLGSNKAHGQWLLYLDADELVTDQLREKIIEVMHTFTESSPKGYFIVRKNYYLGQLWPTRDKMHRLFWSKSLKGWQGKLHETAIVDGEVDTLYEPLIHNTHRTLSEMVSKTNEWSKAEAQLRFRAGHPKIVPWRLVRVFMTGFWQTYSKGGGWRAGTVGMMESMYQGFSLFITYAKLWELQQKA